LGLAIGATWLLPLALTGAVGDLPASEQTVSDLTLSAGADIPFAEIQFQTRIERRVIIRIAPLSPMAPPISLQQRKSEPSVAPRRRPGGSAQQCIAIADIAGVRLGEGRDLLLYMRDRRVIGTRLEPSCQVNGFYSGFYVERPDDGMLCAGREALHARSGGDCMLGSFHELEPDGD